MGSGNRPLEGTRFDDKNSILGLVSSPSIVRKPPSDSSSGLVGLSFASTPTSTAAASPRL